MILFCFALMVTVIGVAVTVVTASDGYFHPLMPVAWVLILSAWGVYLFA